MKPQIHLALLATLACATAHAGAVLTVSTKNTDGKLVPDEVYYAQDGMMRIDSLDSQGVAQRIDIVRDGVIWEIRPTQQTFTRIDSASLNQMMGGGQSRLQAMLANLPPDKRAAIEARMAHSQSVASQATFNDTGRSDHVAQYSCHIWEEVRASKSSTRYCVVPTSALPAGSELEVAMKKAIETTNQILAGVPQMAHEAEHITRLGQMHGFPVRWQDLSSSGSPEDEHVLASAESKTLSPDKFAIPQGFTEKPFARDSQ